MRILLASPDVELGLDILATLEDAGHAVHHVFDLAEALLRASIDVPEVFLIDLGAPSFQHGQLRRWAATTTTPLVILSTPGTSRVARQLGASFVPRPTGAVDERWRATLVDVVQTAAQGPTSSDSGDVLGAPRRRSGTMPVMPAVLVVARGETTRTILGSMIRTNIGVPYVAAADVPAALAALEPPSKGAARTRIRAVVIDASILGEPDGRDLVVAIADLGVQSIPIRVHDDDASAVGTVAWEVLPLLRTAIRGAGSRTA